MSYLSPIATSSTTTQGFSSPSYPSRSPKPSPTEDLKPITRSRTLFYLSIRDSSTSSFSRSRSGRKGHVQYGDTVDISNDDEEREGLIGSGISGGGGKGGSIGIEVKGLPPKWADVSDEVEEILGSIPPKISTLDKLHAKHVLPGFTDRSAEEREIERQTADITRDFRRCTQLVSSIQPSRNAQKIEVLTAKNVQRGLASKIQDMSAVFRKKQRVYMQKLQGHAIKNQDLLIASGAVTLKGPELFDELEEDEQASKSQLQSSYQSQSLTQTQTQATTAVDLDLETRTKEITQIASSISELADLFRDLGNLIVEQGTVLDSVEYNVQTTARELSGAVDELKTAQRYQANTGRRKCILLLILIILGLIIVLIYKPRGGESPNDYPQSDTGADVDIVTTSSMSSSSSWSYNPRPSEYGGGRPPLPKLPPLPVGDNDGGW